MVDCINKIKKIINELMEAGLVAASNTFASDINEILLGLYLAGGDWSKFGNAREAKAGLLARKKQVGTAVYKDQDGRAKTMASKALEWASMNGYDGDVVNVWWTARPGTLAAAVGYPIDSRKNPTDILIKFSEGSFLGISAKSTKASNEIAFKNPGLGTISKTLGIDFGSLVKNIENEMIKKYKLPAGIKLRKSFIRSNPKVQAKTAEAGAQMLMILRDALLKKYQSMSQSEMRKHILTAWFDAEAINPYYIKVTGRGVGGLYNAEVFDLVKDDKFKLISNGKIEAVAVGTNSIGFMADGHRLMKARFKFESEKLASNIKMSGET